MSNGPWRWSAAALCVLTLLAARARAQDDIKIDTPGEEPPPENTFRNEIEGAYSHGEGFDIARTQAASLNISAYGVSRYINQLPATQSFTDHLGRERAIDTRNDIEWQRTFIWLSGFLLTPRLQYTVSAWSLLSTQQTLIFGYLQFMVHPALVLGTGMAPNLGTRSMQGPWPFFMSSDRQMADEFFRPGFANGAWIRGEPLPGLHYWAALTNAISQLGVNSLQLTRELAKSASVWWLPSTGEFGPRGGFGDLELHDRVATRFGASTVYMRDSGYNPPGNPNPLNTQVRLSDGVLLYETGSLADGVTVQTSDFNLLSIDLGMKYRGFHVQTEVYFRWLTDFVADGPLPVDSIFDNGFYVQASLPILPRYVHMYGATGFVFDQFERKPWEIAGGVNYYPFSTRSWRVNLHVIGVHESPAGSQFGFYVAGQSGTTISIGTDFLL
jgi:hypothetical protein